ncbi:Transcription factor lepE [Cladobotryum mycophilum]|uniref:Transcription factor lepE n=1 Tax=Cladobotryum mycophilum TaxID=491253 RepID=A0ABR0SZI1_9HYPO
MNIVELNLDATGGKPRRKKRRPALACQECRRRKIRCDRQPYCTPCVKANIDSCSYVYDDRISPKAAPFEAQDTQFSVFEQTSPWSMATSIASSTSPHSIAGITLEDRAANSDSAKSDSVSNTAATSLRSPGPQLHLDFDIGLDTAFDTLNNSPLHNSDNTASVHYSPLPGILHDTASPSVRGILSDARFFGQSHWINFAQLTPEILAAIGSYEADQRFHSGASLARCKAIGRSKKEQEIFAITAPFFGSARSLIPTRAICDRFVQAYLRTFQTVFGILNVTSFYNAYRAFWNDVKSATEMFNISLLLVMCIGSACGTDDTTVPRAKMLQWISAACTWLNSAERTKSSGMDILRIQCLYVLACQVKAVENENSWLSTGNLVRTAMHMGIHIDAKIHSLGGVSTTDVQSRRRLWATILELELQSSMDHGGQPCIEVDGYDCDLPLNIDDAALENSDSDIDTLVKPLDRLTQSSFQILLMKTIPVRLKIAKFINSFQLDPSFDKALELSTELSAVLKTCSAHIEAYHMSSSPPTAFQTNLFDLLCQRMFLGLHHPFAVKAMTNPAYYYSRKMCFETAVGLLSSSAFSVVDDFHRLRLSSSGIFRTIYTQSALYMCSELNDKSDIGVPVPSNPRVTYVRTEMQDAVQRYLDLATARISAGEIEVKPYVIVSCLLAQAEVIVTGANAHGKICDALQKSLVTSYSLLISHGQNATTSASTRENSSTSPSFTTFEGESRWSQWDDTMMGDINDTNYLLNL